MAARGFPKQKSYDLMIADPILWKRKHGLKESYTTHVWQSRTWNPSLLILCSLILPGNPAWDTEQISLLPCVDRSGYSLFLARKQQSLACQWRPPPTIFLVLFLAAPLYRLFTTASLVHPWAFKSSPKYLCWSPCGYLLLDTSMTPDHSLRQKIGPTSPKLEL